MIKKELGSGTLFFASFVIPIICFFATITIGISEYFLLLQREQKILDTGAKLAISSFPNKSLAIEKANIFIKDTTNIDYKNINFSYKTDTINVVANGIFKISLSNMFNLNIELPIYLTSSARGIPQNIILAVDNSSYLSPHPFHGEPWDIDEWPAASFFSDYFHALNLNKLASSPELISQTCLNPIFNKIKLTTLEIMQFAQASSENNFSMSFFPGKNFFQNEILYLGDQFLNSKGEFKKSFTSSEICAAAIERESLIKKYRYPISNIFYGLDTMIDIPSLNFKNRYLEQLLPEELVWSQRVAKSGIFADIDSILKYAISSLSIVTNKYSNNKIIVVTGDLPYHRQLKFPEELVKNTIESNLSTLNQLSQSTNSKIQLYFLFFLQDEKLESQIPELQNYLSSNMNTSHIDLHVSLVGKDENYISKIYKILLDEQAAILSL